MWMKNIFLAILGLSAGITAAGGLFSFIIGLGVVSDFADRTHTGEHVMLYEDAIAVGGSIGAIISVYHPTIPYGSWLVPLAGLFGGIFVGCWAMALTEMLDLFPDLHQENPACERDWSDHYRNRFWKRIRSITVFLEKVVKNG